MKTLFLTDVKRFVKNKLNLIYLIQIISIFLIGFMIITTNNAFKSTEKKVDFRYFNTTRTLQDIYNVDIDTETGRVIHRIKANQLTL